MLSDEVKWNNIAKIRFSEKYAWNFTANWKETDRQLKRILNQEHKHAKKNKFTKIFVDFCRMCEWVWIWLIQVSLV